MIDLTEAVFCRLVEVGREEKSIDLVLAALNGSEHLDAILGGEESPARPQATTEHVPPKRAYLTKISVEGSRGIGPLADLVLTSGPGLTVSCGRDGAGKTTFAEALECALTATAQSWDQAINTLNAKTVRRNLHHGRPCDIAVGLTEVGKGQATIRVSWAADAAGAPEATRKRSPRLTSSTTCDGCLVDWTKLPRRISTEKTSRVSRLSTSRGPSPTVPGGLQAPSVRKRCR